MISNDRLSYAMGAGVLRAVAICVVAIQLPSTAASLPKTTLQRAVPSYKEAPVFYEFAWEYYGAKENLELAQEGRLNVGIMGIVPIENFRWNTAGKEDSYWIAMENFRYLLPVVNSDRPQDETFVREWIDGWIVGHSLSFAPWHCVDR